MDDPGWIPAVDNLRQIQEGGLEKWLEKQKKRQTLLKELLKHYNEGRSMSFYCKACAKMPIDLINEAIKKAKRRIVSEKINRSNIKSKAKILKSIIKDMTLKSNGNID